MTEEEKQELLSKIDFKPFDFKASLPESMRRDIEISEIYTDFLLNFIWKGRNGQRKIDQLVLDKNKADISLYRFMKKQNAVEFGYAEIIKETDEYVVLKITQEGIWHLNNISKRYRTKSVTLIKRISLYVLKLMRQLWSLVFVSANNRIKVMMESGIAKLILFIMAILSFILKDEIKDLFMGWWNK